MFRPRGFFFAAIVSIWLFIDFFSLFTSSVAAYFFWSWEDKILIVVLIMLGTMFFPLILKFTWKKISSSLYLIIMAVLILLYMLCAITRITEIFAWISVVGTLISGYFLLLTIVHIRLLKDRYFLFYAFIMGIAAYAITRQINLGLPTVIGENVISWLILTAAASASFAGYDFKWQLTDMVKSNTVPVSSKIKNILLSIVISCLLTIGIQAVFNLGIWAALTTEPFSALFLISGVIGITLGELIYLFLPQIKFGKMIMIIISGGLLVLGMMTVFSGMASEFTALIMHGLSVFGIYILLKLSFSKFYDEQENNRFPFLAFQLGFIILVLCFGILMKDSTVLLFWGAAGIALACLIAVEIMDISKTEKKTEFNPGIVVISTVAILSISVFIADMIRLSPHSSAREAYVQTNEETTGEPDNLITVVSSNVQYGWTGNSRFIPGINPVFLQQINIKEDQEDEEGRNYYPDIIGFQEMCIGGVNCGFSDIYTYYKNAMGTDADWYFTDANFGFGQALYSRFPVKEGSIENRRFSAKDMMNRCALYSVIDINGTEIVFIDIHYAHRGENPIEGEPEQGMKENPQRIEQNNEVLQWINGLDDENIPWILVGDFNSEPDSIEINAFHKYFEGKDSMIYQKMLGLIEGSEYNTYSSHSPDKRIDYIFFSNHFNLVDFQVIDNIVSGTGASDHRPILAVLELR